MKSLIAFVLSCFLVGIVETALAGLALWAAHGVERFPIQGTRVYVHSDNKQVMTTATEAIKALKLPHTQVYESPPLLPGGAYALMPLRAFLNLFISCGLVFVIFKRICRMMKIETIV